MLKNVLSFSSEGRIEIKNQKKEIVRFAASIVVLFVILCSIYGMSHSLIFDERTKKYLLIFPIVVFIILGFLFFLIQTCYAWATIVNPTKTMTLDRETAKTTHGAYIHIAYPLSKVDCFKLDSKTIKRFAHHKYRLVLSAEGEISFTVFEIDIDANFGEYAQEDMNYIGELVLMIENVTGKKVVISGDGLDKNNAEPPPNPE